MKKNQLTSHSKSLIASDKVGILRHVPEVHLLSFPVYVYFCLIMKPRFPISVLEMNMLCIIQAV